MTSRASNNIPPSLLKVWKELDDKEKHNNMSGEQKTWTGKAIVARDTLANKGWKIEDVTTREIKDDELLVELVASGICHTDVMCGTGTGNPDLFYYPRVLGHEGKGNPAGMITTDTKFYRFWIRQSSWIESQGC